MTGLKGAGWHAPPANPPLDEGEVHVWRVPLDDVADAHFSILQKFLTSDEIDRANRYHLEKDRRRFITRRGLLRQTLADYMRTDPSLLGIRYNGFGKPYILPKSDQPAPYFSVSHSGGLALLAFAGNQQLGVDIELVKPLSDLEVVAQQFFAQGEIDVIRALPKDARVDAFYRCWTRKEAYIKGVGNGLSIPLDSFEVSLEEASAELLRTDDSLDGADGWSLYGLAPGPNFVGALAFKGQVAKIELFDVELSHLLG